MAGDARIIGFGRGGAWRGACCVVALGAAAHLMAGVTLVDAKTPGETYCYNETCRRVRTLAETTALVGQRMTLKTSFYDHCSRDRFNPCGLTSSGEPFRADDADNAASPDLPDGTLLLLFHPKTNKAAVVRINNAGPYLGDRQLDVSRGTAEALGFQAYGVAVLEAIVLKAPRPAEARYRRMRRYDSAGGFIGSFASLAEANLSLNLETPRENATVVASLIDVDDQLARLMKTLPALALPEAAPAMPVDAMPADVIATIVAGLPPLSARVLLGLPPVFTAEIAHHAVSLDAVAVAAAVAVPDVIGPIAVEARLRSRRQIWFDAVALSARPLDDQPTVTVTVRMPVVDEMIASLRSRVIDAIERARPSVGVPSVGVPSVGLNLKTGFAEVLARQSVSTEYTQ